MTGTHDLFLVILSILLAIFASFTALNVSSRMRVATGATRRLWLYGASLALGGGIWSMHFVGMLAFSIHGMAMRYDAFLTLVSMAVALVFTGIGFALLNYREATFRSILPAGIIMGGGVVTMHYLGMAAMRMHAKLSYSPGWFTLSVAIAVGAATTALWLSAREQSLSRQWLAACLMGAAIAGMHYAGMQAAIFTPIGADAHDHSAAGISQTNLAAIITIITVLILLMALGATQAERMLRAAAQREAEVSLRLAISDILRSSDLQGALTEVAMKLGQHFGVSRTGFGRLEPDDSYFIYKACWTDGESRPLLGRVPAADFGPKIIDALRSGAPIVINDIQTPQDAAQAALFGDVPPTSVRAILVIPFFSRGRLRTILYLNDKNPRRWRSRDIAFLEEIADRTRNFIDRVAVEEQLRELNATLEAKVAAEVDARMQTEEALRHSQKVEAIGQLTGGVAHDFNNLLTVIRGSVDMLRRPSISDQKRLQYIDAISTTADRAARLTGQLLAFARRQALKPEIFDVAGNLMAMQAMITALIGARINLKMQVPPEPVFVNADANQFDTAIVNMVVNARDAMAEEGEITLEVGTTAQMPAIRRQPSVNGDYVTICITDHGKGIPPEDLERIFEPFYTTKGVGAGTGLGLSQVIGFAKQSSGDILVESELGQGTRFTLYLPRVDQAQERASESRSDDALPANHATRVLMVEDNDDVGQFAYDALTELGYITTYARNADEALTALQNDPNGYDILFSDVVMPGVSGLELAKQVRAAYPHIPILLTSGYSHVIAERGHHGFALLHKPYSVEQLDNAIRNMIRVTVKSKKMQTG